MAGKQINFTKKTIEALPSPTKSVRAYYHDTKETGLSVSVTRAGSKTFFVRKRIDGADERITLGRYPDLSIENARKLAAQTKGSIAMGKNPQAEKRAIRDEMTFGKLFELYMERYSKKYKRSWKYDEREVNKHLSHWFGRKISRITNEDVHKLHTELADPKKAWYRLLEVAEIENLRIHDLRRTLGSWQALQGTSTAIIGKSLGHKSQQSTAVYERLTLEPVRQSVQSATEALFMAAKKKEAEHV